MQLHAHHGSWGSHFNRAYAEAAHQGVRLIRRDEAGSKAMTTTLSTSDALTTWIFPKSPT